jgi:hypothetical protein
MVTIFNHTQRFESEIYIGDYTEYAKTHPSSLEKGVKMANMPLDDIEMLSVHNPIHIPVMGVNFELNNNVFKQDGFCSNCECMLVSDKANKKGWLALVELKYCGGSANAVSRNMGKALSQLESTFLHLRDVKKIFKQDDFRFVWVISLPEHDDLIPFSSFYYYPEQLLEYKEKYGVGIFTDNHLTILSHEYIVAL